MKFKTKQEKRAFRMGCACGKKQAKAQACAKAYSAGAKAVMSSTSRKVDFAPECTIKFGAKVKPIRVIPYDLGLMKCNYAEELKRVELAQGKSLRSEEYYHNKAWKALDMDRLLREREQASSARANTSPVSLHVQTRKDKPKRDLDYSGYFAFDERGHIKGHYTCDGFFEPD